jgi:transcriptional regulator with XRE-family HTH domain
MAKNSKKLEGRVLPERLVYARTKKGLTQSQLADELCTAEVTDRTVSVQLVSLMETGTA